MPKGQMLVGRGVQSCELKKKSFFEILFAAPVGTWVRFAGPPGRHSRLNHHAVLKFHVGILGTRFRRRLPFSLQRNTHGKFAEKFGKKKSAEQNCFSLRFSLCFLLFSYFEHCKPSNRKNSRGIRAARNFP